MIEPTDDTTAGQQVARALGDTWLLLAQIDAVACSISLVLDGAGPGVPGAETPAQRTAREALIERLGQADSLASAAANLAGLAQQRVNGVESLLRASR